VRLVVEVKRGYEARVVLNQLYKHTRLQVGGGGEAARPPGRVSMV
jgi:DNA gyrase/topoisomerase IV subunit A